MNDDIVVSTKINKKRVDYIDVARGIAIIVMILGHIIKYGTLRDVIYSFHMPLFIIVSGYFFKENEKFSVCIKKMIKSLILPYIITIIIYNFIQSYMKQYDVFSMFKNIVMQLVYSISFEKNIKFGVESVGAVWFIPFLFICRITFWIICNITKDNKIQRGLLCYMITTLGIYLVRKGYWLPWSVDVVLASMMFMYIGYMLKQFDFINKTVKQWKILIIILLIWIIGIKQGTIELAIRSYPNYITTYITATCGTLVVIYVSYYIDKYIHILARILKWYGKNSMYMLCLHRIEGGVVSYGKMRIILVFVVRVAIATIGTMIYNLLKKAVNYIMKKANIIK